MHPHDHAHHAHGADPGGTRSLRLALLLTLGFAGVEAAGGWWAGSLALLGDAGHMLSDAAALAVAALAAVVARRPASDRFSYGPGRIETVVALGNAVVMLGVVVALAVVAVDRWLEPRPVHGAAVAAVAAVGLLVNLVVVVVLSRGEQTLNTRGAMLHVVGDALGSVAALTSGAVIHFTGWTPVDPMLSALIGLLILRSALSLLGEALHVLMEGVPSHIRLPEVGRAVAAVDGVRSVHDLHIWTLSSGKVALSAHLLVDDLAAWPGLLEQVRTVLRHGYGIDHVTLQPEPAHQVIRPMAWVRPGDRR